MNITQATAQGFRTYQEDRFVCSNQRDGKLIAVMDGHGGAGCSSRLAALLPELWRKHRPSSLSVEFAISAIFKDLDAATSSMHDGSTISLVFIPTAADEVHVAVLGDSPVIILDAEGHVDVSPMHNARSNAAERDAAQARGAFFDGNYIFASWGSHGIQMTRSLGDADLAKILNRVPEVYTRKINSESFVLVATDGLLDPAHHKTKSEIDSVVAQIRAGADARDLVNHAVAVPTGDNVTAILVRLGNRKERKKKLKLSSPRILGVDMASGPDWSAKLGVVVKDGVPTFFPITVDQGSHDARTR